MNHDEKEKDWNEKKQLMLQEIFHWEDEIKKKDEDLQNRKKKKTGYDVIFFF